MILKGSNRKLARQVDGEYVGSLTENERKLIKRIYDAGVVNSLTHALEGKVLKDFQTILPSIAYISKKFIIGADTGLGKSLMIALYLKIHKEKGTLNKAIVVTTTSSLDQIRNEIVNSTGLKVVHLPGDSKQLLETLRSPEFREADVYIVTNSVFSKSVDFNRYYLMFKSLVNVFVFDESMAGANPSSFTHRSIKQWIKSCEYRLFCNATVIERSLDQLYYQFELLDEDLLPSLESLKRVHERKHRKTKETVYVGIDKLLEKLPYHYCNISRIELGQTFDYEDIVVPIPVTPLQKKVATPQNYLYAYFSPTTQKETSVIPFNRQEVPALDAVVKLTKYALKDGGVIIYADPVECKKVIRENLMEEIPGINVGIIDGGVNSNSYREHLRLSFNRGDIQVLIINIPEALNLDGGRSMIFYTIPAQHYQARNRMPRGFDIKHKLKYYYPVPLNSHYSEYIKTTLVNNEITLDESLNRGLVTARKISAKLKELEKKGGV